MCARSKSAIHASAVASPGGRQYVLESVRGFDVALGPHSLPTHVCMYVCMYDLATATSTRIALKTNGVDQQNLIEASTAPIRYRPSPQQNCITFLTSSSSQPLNLFPITTSPRPLYPPPTGGLQSSHVLRQRLLGLEGCFPRLTQRLLQAVHL